MIKENFIPLTQALDEAIGKMKFRSRQSAENNRDLDIAGIPATPAQEAALIALLDMSEVNAAVTEAIRVFTSPVDENPWSPV